MAIFYPDISGFDAGISIQGAQAVCIKATEGTGFTNPDYLPAVHRAALAGVFSFAYHFLHQGNAVAQADFCFRVVGKRPLMLDWEETTGSEPGVSDAVAFIDRYRQLGGVVYLLYLPGWYWRKIGSPSLQPLIDRRMLLVSSQYTSYSDSGPGWQAYGGMSPVVWQYTDSIHWNGFPSIDFNAFKGTLDQFKSLVSAGGAEPVLSPGSSGSEVSRLQGRLNVWGASLTVDGSFGAATEAAVKAFQTSHQLTVDGVVGPATWSVLMTNPGSPAQASSSFHGEYVTGGEFDLAQLANKLGQPVNALLRMTAVHFGAFDPLLAGWLVEVLTGVKPYSTPVPKGAKLWCD